MPPLPETKSGATPPQPLDPHAAARSQRPHLLQTVRVVAPKDPMEARFIGMLTEDRAQTSMSYVEFLCHVHRQIQQKFQN